MKSSAKDWWKGYILLFTCLVMTPAYGFAMLENVKSVHDLCRANRHMYEITENSSFQLTLRSDAKSTGNKMVLKKLKTKCTLTLKVCSSCHVAVAIQNMTIPSCSAGCSCNYFEIQEPLSSYRSQKYCGEQRDKVLYFESKTKIVYFDFVQSVHEKFYVSLDFEVKHNVFFYRDDLEPQPKYIETPYFPSGYPSDYEAEYNFQVLDPNGYVQLLFVDFQLSQASYVEVSGHNGTKVEVFSGANFRPPVIICHGAFLRVKFQANDQSSSRGFRAMYTFGSDIGDYPIVKPHTECGGNKDESGGVIELKVPQLEEELFDCIWLVQPPLFAQQSELLAASVTEFRNIGPGSSLEFRKGLTSKSDLVQFSQCRYSANCSSELEKLEVISEAEMGFYVRFRGYVKKDSSLILTYYKFQEDNCSGSNFFCHAGRRCINSALTCDGYPHCPDKSDELHCTAVANSTILGLEDKDGSPPFIKKRLSLDSSNSFFMFMFVGCCGLLTVALILLVAVYNRFKYRRRMLQRARNAGRRNAVVFMDNFLSVDSDVPAPLADFPPSYEDVLAFNERYPPLFYTRSRPRIMETCLDARMCQGDSLPKLDANHVEGSVHVNTVSLSNETLAVNVSCERSNNFHCLDVSFMSKNLHKSVSSDLATREIGCPVYCQCRLSFVLPFVHSATCVRDFSSHSLPCDFRLHSPVISSDIQHQCHFSDEQASSSCNCSLITCPVHRSELVLSIGNRCFRCPARRKTCSF